MRDDVNIPNLGQAPGSYDVGYFNRLVSNIEMTFTKLLASGRLRSSVVNYAPTVFSALPPKPLAGDNAFVSNGRKNGEGAGLGTGVMAFYDGTNWIACDSGQPVTV